MAFHSSLLLTTTLYADCWLDGNGNLRQWDTAEPGRSKWCGAPTKDIGRLSAFSPGDSHDPARPQKCAVGDGPLL